MHNAIPGGSTKEWGRKQIRSGVCNDGVTRMAGPRSVSQARVQAHTAATLKPGRLHVRNTGAVRTQGLRAQPRGMLGSSTRALNQAFRCGQPRRCAITANSTPSVRPSLACYWPVRLTAVVLRGCAVDWPDSDRALTD